MNNLQEKYKSYKTPFDESAFEHFKTIKQKDKPGQKVNSWYFAVVLLLFLIPATFFVFSPTAPTDTTIQDVSVASKQEKKQNSELKTPDVNETQKYDNESDIKEQKPVVIETILNEKITNNPTYLIKKQKEIRSIPPTKQPDAISDVRNDLISTNQHLIIQNNNTHPNKTDFIQYKIPIIAAQKTVDVIESKNDAPKIQTKKKVLEPQRIALQTPLLKHDNSSDFELSPILNPVTPPDLLGTSTHYRNHLKLSYNYADFYPGSSLLGMIPGYKTPSYFIQGEYRREFNKILSLGSSVGYARGVDPTDTQVVDSLSYQNITFAHLNLYLFLVNSKKHQLYFKVGSGITNTKRQYSSYSFSPPDIIIPNLRYTNLTSPGLLVEVSYAYHFTDHWFMGANLGVIAHNDGASYGGLSMGYSF